MNINQQKTSASNSVELINVLGGGGGGGGAQRGLAEPIPSSIILYPNTRFCSITIHTSSRSPDS